MKTSFLILFILLWCQWGQAQYVLTGRSYTDTTVIPYDDLNDAYIEGYKNTVRFYNRIPDSALTKMIVTDISTETMLPINSFTIADVKTAFRYDEIIAMDNYDILIGHCQLCVYNRKNQEIHYRGYITDTIKYDMGYVVNDSLLYMSSIYNYRPLDGFPGAHLSIFNLKTKEFTKHKQVSFKGISLSPMIHTWDYCNSGNVYLVHPLSGLLFTYNIQLELLDSFYLDIPWNQREKNIQYQDLTDSFVYAAYDQTTKVVAAYGKGYVRENRIHDPWYGKAGKYMDSMIRNTRNNYEYIEKLIPFNDTIIMVTVSRPGYALEYRDVYFYNLFSKKIVGKKEKWVCAKRDKLEKAEDFFVVDLLNSPPYMPYFHKGKIYSQALYDPALYKNVSKKEFSEILYNDVLKNNYKWRILEYTFSLP